VGILELNRFQEHFQDYKLFVYRGLGCDDIMFEGQVDSSKRLNILYDDVDRHYHVITNVTGAMARRHVCKACNKSCRIDITHVCDQTCSDCMTCPPCAFSDARFPCDKCNIHLEVGRDSLTTSRALQKENANVNFVAQRADCS